MKRRNLSILFVTSHCPHAASYGAQLRVLNIARLLGQLGSVDFVIASHGDIDEADVARTRQEFGTTDVVRVEPNSLGGLWERIRFELDPAFLNTHFSAVCDSDRRAMMQNMGRYDLVWVHTMRTANEFGIYRWPHTVLDVDDIQSKLYATRTKADSGVIRSVLDYRMAFVWRRRERFLGDRFDSIVVCSENDRRYLCDNLPITVVPNGFSRPSEEPDHAPAKPARLGFIGLFGYGPNQEGAQWFIKEVWPVVKRDAPDTRLRLVGKGSGAGFSHMGPDIDGLGYVEDPSEEISSWSAMIVPIRIGGGTRIKIAEAFSKKCPVVSTSLGAFGYDVVDRQDLMLADTAQDFASACLSLIKDENLGSILSENGWEAFLRHWTWESMFPAVSRVVEECLREDQGITRQVPIVKSHDKSIQRRSNF